MSLEIEVLPPLELVSSRAEEVRLSLLNLKDALMVTSLQLGRLLREARNNQYHLIWGFHRWGDWVEEASGLDLSERQSYYLIAVVDKAEQLGIPDEQLQRVKLSKLKTIFSLPADTDPDVVRGLVKDAEESSLKSIQETVGLLKDQDFVYKTVKLERTTYDNVWLPALERARREYGNTMGFAGDLADIEDSRAIELICGDYLANPDEELQYTEGEVLDAEFEDVLLPA